jgi:hypothetical protein
VPIAFKFGSLNLLEPSGPVQACNGIALPFTEREQRKDQRINGFFKGEASVLLMEVEGKRLQ